MSVAWCCFDGIKVPFIGQFWLLQVDPLLQSTQLQTINVQIECFARCDSFPMPPNTKPNLLGR
uniref:Uncharacterized protein n=1 Tax=Lepeophtheirus salmonis TaxID=72036 RepID=A0A0K2TN13_LEPSM